MVQCRGRPVPEPMSGLAPGRRRGWRGPRGHQRLGHRVRATNGAGNHAGGVEFVERFGRLKPAFELVVLIAFEGELDHPLLRCETPVTIGGMP